MAYRAPTSGVFGPRRTSRLPAAPKPLAGIVPYNPASGQTAQQYLGGLGGTLNNSGGTWSLTPNKPSGVAGPQPAPAAPGVAPVSGASPQGETDARYTLEAGKLLFGNTNTITDLKRDQGYDDTDYAESGRRLAEQRVQALQNADETANSQGLFYSGVLGKRRGDLETNYQRQGSDMRDNYERTKLARNDAVSRIEHSQPIDLEGLRLDSLGRLAQARVDAPAPDPNAIAPMAPGQTAKSYLGSLPFKLAINGKGQFAVGANGKKRRIVGNSLV